MPVPEGEPKTICDKFDTSQTRAFFHCIRNNSKEPDLEKAHMYIQMLQTDIGRERVIDACYQLMELVMEEQDGAARDTI